MKTLRSSRRIEDRDNINECHLLNIREQSDYVYDKKKLGNIFLHSLSNHYYSNSNKT